MRRGLVTAALLPLLVACTGAPSLLDPAGPDARQALGLFELALRVAAPAFLLIGAALLLAILAPRRFGERFGFWLVAGGGVALPAVALPLLLASGLRIPSPFAGQSEGAFTIDVVAWQFWWEFRYPNPERGGPPVVSANDLRIPAGVPVRLRLVSQDVIHSFRIPKLGGRLDIVPGHTSHALLRADGPGLFRGACFEFCGLQHANMAFTVQAMERAEWEAWLRHEARPAAEPETAEAQRGRQVFAASGCGSCHAVRGHGFEGRVAPDLTHLASRPTIGAGMLPNTRGSLAGWIAAVQQIKPGADMPNFNLLSGQELQDLSSYLEGLR